jgi:hypothetical protein
MPSRMVELHLHSLTDLHAIVLNQLSPGANLLYKLWSGAVICSHLLDTHFIVSYHIGLWKWRLGIYVKSTAKTKDEQSLQNRLRKPHTHPRLQISSTLAPMRSKATGSLHHSLQFLVIVRNFNIYSCYRIHQVAILCPNFKLEILDPPLIIFQFIIMKSYLPSLTQY